MFMMLLEATYGLTYVDRKVRQYYHHHRNLNVCVCVSVMRIQPRVNENINEEWLSDRSRYSYDGLYRQRLDTPLLRKGSNEALEEATWPEALEYVASRIKELKPNQVCVNHQQQAIRYSY